MCRAVLPVDGDGVLKEKREGSLLKCWAKAKREIFAKGFALVTFSQRVFKPSTYYASSNSSCPHSVVVVMLLNTGSAGCAYWNQSQPTIESSVMVWNSGFKNLILLF